jgi:uncharacterized protein (DUF433 family)
MGDVPRIHADPRILGVKPVIRGTRVSVELILRKLSEGATPDDLIAAYSHPSGEDIRAAFAFAADLGADESEFAPAPPASGKPSRR